MELLAFGKELVQEAVDFVTSYKIGQTMLRQVDRVLWVLEKSARWAVPPPLDQDDRPQPELVRPLPWVFFLALLVTLRVTRESISIINLFRGKPPLRSADVVMYIQSKRRYLRTLKYQGNRTMRARSQQSARAPAPAQWLARAAAALRHAACFRRPAPAYGNNNTTDVSNNEEILVIKNNKGGCEHQNAGDDTMERLIEKMMADLNTDTDDDSSYTLTNATGAKSNSDASDDGSPVSSEAATLKTDLTTSTPVKENCHDTNDETTIDTEAEVTVNNGLSKDDDHISEQRRRANTPNSSEVYTTPKSSPEASEAKRTIKEDTDVLLQNERNTNKKMSTPPKKQKIVNGQAQKSSPKRKKGGQRDRSDSDVPVVRITSADDSNDIAVQDNSRQPH